MKKLLLLIISFESEKKILNTIDKISDHIFNEYQTEILIIDMTDNDNTFEVVLQNFNQPNNFKINILKNPEKLGYGANQKIGFEYAIKNNFEFLIVLHGDGKYAPEKIGEMIKPIIEEKASIVIGSRMKTKRQALKEGMPIYRYAANKFLTKFQNMILQEHITDYHSGYRAFDMNIIKETNFKYNSNDYHFDTEILIQLSILKSRIYEIQIPSYYDKEIRYLKGFKYFLNTIKAMLKYKIHTLNIFYQRKFDLSKDFSPYELKLGYKSSHSITIKEIPNKSRVLDIGCGLGYVSAELLKKGCFVQGLDKIKFDNNNFSNFIQWDLDNDSFPLDFNDFDYILLLDIIEHLKKPELFMDIIRKNIKMKRPKIIITVPNIAFIVTRLSLLFGKFNYGKVGILDLTHTRLFTFRSLKELLIQSGYKIIDIQGVPAPYPKAIGNNIISKFLMFVNEVLIKIYKSFFSYQLYFVVEPITTIENLLKKTIDYSDLKRKEFYEKSSS